MIKKLHTPHTKRIQKALIRSGAAARRMARYIWHAVYVWRTVRSSPKNLNWIPRTPEHRSIVHS